METTLPATLTDRQGNQATVRLAVHADRAQVASTISDQKSTGSHGLGHGNKGLYK